MSWIFLLGTFNLLDEQTRTNPYELVVGVVQFIFIFLYFAMDHFDCFFTKNNGNFILPKHYHFLSIWDYVGGVIPRNILNAHFASLHCLNITFIITIIFMSNIE